MVQQSLANDDLGEPLGWRCISAAMRAYFAIDNCHADAWKIPLPDRLEHCRTRRMLRLIHQNEIGGVSVFNQPDVEVPHSRSISCRKAKGDFRRNVSQTR